ncbi:MAG TPA: TetR/AcrR family transcriptional regulator [Methanosarcinales archaeon]|nr:TetR/AcrR family transcriptional regulator [Methanosarcinales archaeon]
MARTVKCPEIRCSDTIEELFLWKGCGETVVSDIVGQVGVSQGAFYHYYKSKGDTLDAITSRWIEEIRAGIGDISSRDGSDAIEKTPGAKPGDIHEYAIKMEGSR